MMQLSSDQLYEILRNTRYEDISYLCRTNKDFDQLCRSARGIKAIQQLKHRYQLNLVHAIQEKIDQPVTFFYTLSNFSSFNQKIIDDYWNTLYDRLIDFLNKNRQALDLLIRDINLTNFDFSHPNKLEHFLDLYKQHYGDITANDIVYTLRIHFELIPMLNDFTRDAIRIFLLDHPEILVPLLQYLDRRT